MDSQVELIYQTVKQDITYQEISSTDPFGYDNDEFKGGIPILEPVKCEPYDPDVKILDSGGDQMATLQPVNCFDYDGSTELVESTDGIQSSTISTLGQEPLTILPLSTSSFEFGGETWQVVTQPQVLQQVTQITLPQLHQLQQITTLPGNLQQVTLPGGLQQVVLTHQASPQTIQLKSNYIESFITADSTMSSDHLENDLSNQAYPVQVKQEFADTTEASSNQMQFQQTSLMSNDGSFSEDSTSTNLQNQVYESLDGLALRYEVISNGTATISPMSTVSTTTTATATSTSTSTTPRSSRQKAPPKEKIDLLGHMIREEQEETGPAWYCRLCSYQTRDRRYIRKHVSRVHCKKDGAGPPKPKPITTQSPVPTQSPPTSATQSSQSVITIQQPSFTNSDDSDVTSMINFTNIQIKQEPLDLLNTSINNSSIPSEDDIKPDMNLVDIKPDLVEPDVKPVVKLQVKRVKPPVIPKPKPPPVQHICDICGWKARARYLLQNHFIAKHQEGRPFPCELCSYKAKFKSSYLRHVQTIHEGLRPFSCQYCTYKATQKSCLERHVKAQHSQTKPFGCSFCPYRAMTKPEVEKHVDEKHDGRRPFSCYTCGFTTLLKRHLREHMLRKHDGRRPYACTYPECSYRTLLKRSLDNHVKYKHLALRPFQCYHCTYNATSKPNLRAHIVSIHLRDRQPKRRRGVRRDQVAGRPVLCECGLMTESRIAYAKHRGEVHGEEVLACSVCPYLTTVASNLHKHTANKHLRSHGMLQGFRACAYCQFNSHSKRALRLHIKTVHKIM